MSDQSRGWQHGRTAAETFGPHGAAPSPEWQARLAEAVDATDPPPLVDVEKYPDVRDDPAFEPAPPAWRLGVAAIEQASMSTPADDTATVQPLPELAREPDILALAADTLERSGVAGERRLVMLIYLVTTSRLLGRIVSMAIKGPSAAGKSYLIQRVLELFPASAYHALSAMSERALIYDATPLRHRMLVIYEAAGMAGDMQTYIIRSLLSEGRVRYSTVDKVKGEGLRPRLIEREGPTGLLTTTTEVKLHPENETRLLSVTVKDSPEQTRAVILAHAGGGPVMPDVRPWHALQGWLARQPTDVAIPYLMTLAQNIPAVAVRLRRDFPAIVSLIRAHAVLHQASRDRDEAGAIVATIDDYARVRELVADLIAEAVERSVSDTIRETVETVRLLTDPDGETTVVGVAQALNIDKSAASRRVRVALDRGYLRNLEDKRGRPLRLVAGDPLPEEQVVLPDPSELERLHGCTDPARTHIEDDYPASAWETN